MVSAIKVKGKKLYEYQRENVEVERQPREIEIRDISLTSLTENSISFRAEVSSGTYIRTLCEDIAEKMGQVGTMSYLRRCAIGKFRVEEALLLDEISQENCVLRPVSDLIEMERVEYDDPSDIYNGRRIKLDTKAERVLVMLNKQAQAVYEREESGLYRCVRGLW